MLTDVLCLYGVMPSPAVSPVSNLYGKSLVPSELRSVDWDIVPVWCRERAFFMATVDNFKTLAAFRAKASDILEGKLTAAEARRDLRAMLAAQGYTPTPGTEGSIKDLRSVARMDVTLDTNVRMCQGYAQRQRQLGSVSHPAQKLVRIRQSREPRDWMERWTEAGTAVGWEGVSKSVLFVALLRSPVWRELSRFGTDYPPFDFNSGMGVAAVSWDDAEAAGLIPDDETADKLMDEAQGHHLEALNKDLETDFRGGSADKRLRDEMSSVLGGMAEWDGDVLKFTDPNGSRPVRWQEAGSVIGARLPEGFAAPQKEAVAEWVRDSSQFQPDQDGEYGAGLNIRESAWRAFDRIIPTTSEESGTLYRGMDLRSKEGLNDFLGGISATGYTPRKGKVADSWSTSERTAERFSRPEKSSWRVVLRSTDYKSGKRIDRLVDTLQQQGILDQPNPAHPHVTEGETLFLQGTRFRVTGMDKSQMTKDGGIIYVDVAEL